METVDPINNREEGLIKMDEIQIAGIVGGGIILLLVIGLVISIYDVTYKLDIAAEKANLHCKAIGFDQHKSFTRVGYLSEEPVGIKCEYAERYTDLGIRSNS